MFKRLMLDKYQEKLFSSLPKPNLTNLDIRDLADPTKLEKEKNKYSEGSTTKLDKTGDVEDPAKSRNSHNFGAKGLFYIDKDDEAKNSGKKPSKKQNNSQTSESESDADSDEELRDAYNDLKTRQHSDEITKKLLKAFENSVLKVTDKSKAGNNTSGSDNDSRALGSITGDRDKRNTANSLMTLQNNLRSAKEQSKDASGIGKRAGSQTYFRSSSKIKDEDSTPEDDVFSKFRRKSHVDELDELAGDSGGSEEEEKAGGGDDGEDKKEK